MLSKAVRAMLFPVLKEQNLNGGIPSIKGHFMEKRFVSYPCVPPMQGAAGRGWAKLQVHSPSFPLYYLCFAVCVCLTTQGIVRTYNDSKGPFVSSPLLCNSSTT